MLHQLQPVYQITKINKNYVLEVHIFWEGPKNLTESSSWFLMLIWCFLLTPVTSKLWGRSRQMRYMYLERSKLTPNFQNFISLDYKVQCTISRGVRPNFEITVAFGLKFHWYLRTLSLKFQKARTKIEVFLSLPCWQSQLNWDSQQGKNRKFCLYPEILNFYLKSSNTPETVDFTPPW